MSKIQVLYVKPGYQPELIDCENDIVTFQHLVDGYVEPVIIGRNLTALVNEEGAMLGMSPNFGIGYTSLVGPIVVVQDKGDGEYSSLTSSQVAEVWQIVREGRGYDRPLRHRKELKKYV